MTDRELEVESGAAFLQRQIAAVGDESVCPPVAIAEVEVAVEPPIPVEALAIVDELLAALYGKVSQAASSQRVDAPEMNTSSKVVLVDGTTVVLAPGESLVIGRGADADRHQLSIPQLSRGHLRLVHSQGLWATDLASTNGTNVEREGAVIELGPDTPFQLLAGDRLLVGTAPIGRVEREGMQ